MTFVKGNICDRCDKPFEYEKGTSKINVVLSQVSLDDNKKNPRFGIDQIHSMMIPILPFMFIEPDSNEPERIYEYCPNCKLALIKFHNIPKAYNYRREGV